MTTTDTNAYRCRHCRTNRQSRPRGLCHRCFYADGVRYLYPVKDAPSARRLAPDRYGPAPLPAEPTPHRPGSPEKAAVLQERAAAGVCLFHPHDARG